MKLSRFLTVFLIWSLLRSTLGSVAIFKREDVNFVQQRNSSPAFMCCSLKTSEDMLSTELQPANISEIRDVLDRSNSILNANRIPNSKPGKVNYYRCVLCLFHPITCAVLMASEKDSICITMNIRGYAERPVERSSGKEIKQESEKEKISTGNQTGNFEDINIPIAVNIRGYAKRLVERSSGKEMKQASEEEKISIGNQTGNFEDINIPKVNIRGYVKRLVERSSGKEIKQASEKEKISTGNQTGNFEDINIPIGGGPSMKRSIQRRSMGPCGVPTSMSTASISCRSYPSRVVCLQHCAFGHTLEKGIQQKLECSQKDGVWKPGKFKECKPFVDCTPSLSSGGSVSCSAKSGFENPECRVSCLPYEDKEAVEAQTYVCSIEGKWDPPLPFCVTPGSGMLLVKAPKIKLHENMNKT